MREPMTPEALAEFTEDSPYPNLSVDQLIRAIKLMFPGAEHGMDFMAAWFVDPITNTGGGRGFLVNWRRTEDEPTGEEIDAFVAANEALVLTPTPKADQIDVERDRRISAGIMFNGAMFQTDGKSRERTDRARISALAAIINGAQPGDLRWHGEPVDFAWIALADSRMPMDAFTMMMFGNAVAAHEGVHILAANDLKNADPIPADFATNESYWP